MCDKTSYTGATITATTTTGTTTTTNNRFPYSFNFKSSLRKQKHNAMTMTTTTTNESKHSDGNDDGSHQNRSSRSRSRYAFQCRLLYPLNANTRKRDNNNINKHKHNNINNNNSNSSTTTKTSSCITGAMILGMIMVVASLTFLSDSEWNVIFKRTNLESSLESLESLVCKTITSFYPSSPFLSKLSCTNDNDNANNIDTDTASSRHVPIQNEKSESSLLTSSSSYFHVHESDYEYLLNITTQIGTYNPLLLMHSVTGTLSLSSAHLNNIDMATSSSLSSSAMKQQQQVLMMKPTRFIPVLEARGSFERDIDKDEYGHRRDTLPIANAIDQYSTTSTSSSSSSSSQKVHSAVLQFLEEDIETTTTSKNNINASIAKQSNQALFHYLRHAAHGIIVRNNPGTLSPLSQKKFDDMLRELNDKYGTVVLSHPDVSSTLGAKDSLVKIRHLKCGLDDTEVYYDANSFREGFMKRISHQPRVIKQNRGSQGEGVWIVKLKDESAYCNSHNDNDYGTEECRLVSLDTELELMEAFDNHVEYHTVGEFIEFCIHGRSRTSTAKTTCTEWSSTSNGRYFEGGIEAGAMVVDQRFLPRIVEGEVRCLMVGSELVEIVHKKPKEGGLSATLQSGAVYTKYPPDDPKFAKLVKNFKDDVPRIMKSFGMEDQPLPLLWTVDYIYGETDEDLHAGEINCSCPGITQQLHITPTIANVAVQAVFER